MITKTAFSDTLKAEMQKNYSNNYEDNWDHVLFGISDKPSTFKGKLNLFLRKALPKTVYINLILKVKFKKHLDGLASLYNRLNDEYSRSLLIQVLTHRLIGNRKHKLPLSNQKYWDNLKLAETLIIEKDDFIDPNFLDFKLQKHDLRAIGYPITLYFTSLGVLIDFIIKQYEYNANGKIIKANKGDVVLDCGGCWGDTALFFSNEVGELGKIYSFEFIPSNIEIYKKNLLLNPHLSGCVNIVRHPIWDKSNEKLYYKDFGPASTVSSIKTESNTEETETVSIDDFVKNEGLEKVDFIKMDIEGAEYNAILGAKETITKFKPTLAIAVYHDISHFYIITQFLDSLKLGYKYYFQHTTIHAGESVIFAEI